MQSVRDRGTVDVDPILAAGGAAQQREHAHEPPGEATRKPTQKSGLRFVFVPSLFGRRSLRFLRVCYGLEFGVEVYRCLSFLGL